MKKLHRLHHQWTQKLPQAINRCATLWGLMGIVPFEQLAWNYVAHARQGEQQVVLKICSEAAIYYAEVIALEAFTTYGGVKLLAKNDADHALLLELLNPGISLATLVADDDDKATSIAVALIKQLHKAPVPAVASSIYEWLDIMECSDNVPFSYKKKALEVAKKLRLSSENEYFLHGDLHHDNILKTESDWKAIDPKGIVGPQAAEVAVMLYNPISLLAERPDATKIIKNRVMLYAKLLENKPEIICNWGYIRCVLALCWASDDGQKTDNIMHLVKIFDALTT